MLRLAEGAEVAHQLQRVQKWLPGMLLEHMTSAARARGAPPTSFPQYGTGPDTAERRRGCSPHSGRLPCLALKQLKSCLGKTARVARLSFGAHALSQRSLASAGASSRSQ